jgi:hypothetical protein
VSNAELRRLEALQQPHLNRTQAVTVRALAQTPAQHRRVPYVAYVT